MTGKLVPNSNITTATRLIQKFSSRQSASEQGPPRPASHSGRGPSLRSAAFLRPLPGCASSSSRHRRSVASFSPATQRGLPPGRHPPLPPQPRSHLPQRASSGSRPRCGGRCIGGLGEQLPVICTELLDGGGFSNGVGPRMVTWLGRRAAVKVGLAVCCLQT